MTDNFYAVILSGGSGERFWPLSTPERPKQFLSIFGGKSLLRLCVDRLEGLVPPERILVITAKSLARRTRKELPEIPRRNMLLEPCRRDTAAAVATACTAVRKAGGEDAVMAILPADHLIKDCDGFRGVLSLAADAAARSRDIVTMGVKPTYPATGFGYIKIGRPAGKGLCRAERFVEKPGLSTAKKYVKSGGYAWNAGMFVTRVSTLEQAFADHAPHLLGIALKDYERLPRISFDYAVMEKAKNVLVAPGDFGWDDVGTWTSAGSHFEKSGSGNAVRGPVALVETSDSIAVAEGAKIVTLGVENLVIVTTKDTVFVADRNRVQDLKQMLSKLPAGIR